MNSARSPLTHSTFFKTTFFHSIFIINYLSVENERPNLCTHTEDLLDVPSVSQSFPHFVLTSTTHMPKQQQLNNICIQVIGLLMTCDKKPVSFYQLGPSQWDGLYPLCCTMFSHCLHTTVASSHVGSGHHWVLCA